MVFPLGQDNHRNNQSSFMKPNPPQVSALSTTGDTGLGVWLQRSLGVVTSFFTETFLNALSVQVDREQLLIYVVTVQLLWLPLSSFLRQIVTTHVSPGLGWRYHNLTLIDFVSQVTIFLTFGIISQVLGDAWSSGAFNVFEITVYGVLLIILFFVFYSYVRVLMVDMLGLLNLYEKIKKASE